MSKKIHQSKIGRSALSVIDAYDQKILLTEIQMAISGTSAATFKQVIIGDV